MFKTALRGDIPTSLSYQSPQEDLREGVPSSYTFILDQLQDGTRRAGEGSFLAFQQWLDYNSHQSQAEG